MTKNKIKIFFLILFLIILLFVFLGFNTFTGGNYREDLGFKIAKKIIPTNIKNQIKDFFKIASRKEKKVTESLINKEKELLKILNDENKEKELSKTLINREKELLGNIRLLNEKIVNKNSYIKALEDTVRNKDLNIEKLTNDSEFKTKQLVNILRKLDKFSFIKKEETIINEKYKLTSFHTEDLIFSKNANQGKATAYIENYKNKILLATADGIFMYFDDNQFHSETIKAHSISTNLFDLIPYSNFYYSSDGYGIKDLLIISDKLYMSYVKRQKNNCFNIAILVADLNFENLIFRDFFSPKYCLYDNDPILIDGFTGHLAGGRLAPYIDEQILLTTGDFKARVLSQDLENILGKTLSISSDGKNYKILDMGRRNSQGMFYNIDKNYIISTEHGPEGGDEININLNPDNGKIKNYGWPISSYGKHRNDKERPNAPLHKSHEKYGFIEPLIHYTPGIGISQIINVPDKFKISNDDEYFVSSLGVYNKKGIHTIQHIRITNDMKLFVEEEIIIGERIRDLIYLENLNKILLFLENTPSLSLLEKID